MALEGTIKDFGLPEIFQLIGLQRKTGTLSLGSGKENVTVTFENGMVVNADSASRRLEDRLGNVLVKQGKLSPARLEEALSVQKQTLQRLGHVLATNNFITTKDLKEALQVQVAQIVFKVFRWRDGRYNFAATDTVDYDRENFTPMSADFILMEGIRMVDEWPIIEKKIPSFDIVFRPVVDAAMIELGSGSGPEDSPGPPEGKRSLASSTTKIRLTNEEERIYRRVDGTRTVQAIIDASGVGEFEVCRTLFDLLNRNIIAPAGRGVARDQAEAAPAGGIVSKAPGYVVAVLAVLLALGGAVAQLDSPFAFTGLPPFLQGSYGRLLEAVRLSRLQRLDLALQAYQLMGGAPPRSLEELVSAGLVDRAYLEDPQGQPYRYTPTATGYLLEAVEESGRAVSGDVIERALPVERP